MVKMDKNETEFVVLMIFLPHFVRRYITYKTTINVTYSDTYYASIVNIRLIENTYVYRINYHVHQIINKKKICIK